MHAPIQRHLDAVNHIRRYLKGTPGKDLLFRKSDNCEIDAILDAD